MAVAFFGPWYGEFGWELCTWQAFCRKKAREFDKVYASSFPDMEALYADFAIFIPHNFTHRLLDWRDIDRIPFEMPHDVDVHIRPHKRYRVEEQEFIKFGDPPLFEFDFLVHARGIQKASHRNYNKEKWKELVKRLPGSVATIGTLEDYSLPGVSDLRGIPLQELMRYIAGCKIVLGQSSGTMHLPKLCGTPSIVWGDGKKYFGETSKLRYEKTWNPFGTPVVYITDDRWQPNVDDILRAVDSLLNKTPFETTSVEVGRPFNQAEKSVPLLEPQAIEKIINYLQRDSQSSKLEINGVDQALELAKQSGRWFLTVTWVDPEDEHKFLHHWEMNRFPSGEVIRVLEHLKADVAEKVANQNVGAKYSDWQ